MGLFVLMAILWKRIDRNIKTVIFISSTGNMPVENTPPGHQYARNKLWGKSPHEAE